MIDPSEADIYGFGPQLGAPVMHLPDGRRVAFSRYEEQFIGLAGVGLMVYVDAVGDGVFLWRPFRWDLYWETGGMMGGEVASDRTLAHRIAEAGGPAPFVLSVKSTVERQLVEFLGFAPRWGETGLDAILDSAVAAWQMVTILPGLVLPIPAVQPPAA